MSGASQPDASQPNAIDALTQLLAGMRLTEDEEWWWHNGEWWRWYEGSGWWTWRPTSGWVEWEAGRWRPWRDTPASKRARQSE